MSTPKYPLNAEGEMRLHRTYTYHAPKADQTGRYAAIRELAQDLAREIGEDCPETREKSLALTNLEQAVMWANAAIARNET